jgi:hypothetical protein
MILHDERKKFLFFFKVIGQDHSFFNDLTGVFCIVGGTLVESLPSAFFTMYLSASIDNLFPL